MTQRDHTKRYLCKKVPGTFYTGMTNAVLFGNSRTVSAPDLWRRAENLTNGFLKERYYSTDSRLGKTGFGVRKWAHRSKDLSQQDNNSYYLVRYL